MLKERTLGPLSQPPFVIYFFAVVIGVGGIGIWMALAEGPEARNKAISTGMATYLIALVASAFADILLADDMLASFRSFALAVAVAAVALGFLGLWAATDGGRLVSSVSGASLSLYLWWLANADNTKLQDQTPEPEVATGGSTSTPLKGSLEGINA